MQISNGSKRLDEVIKGLTDHSAACNTRFLAVLVVLVGVVGGVFTEWLSLSRELTSIHIRQDTVLERLKDKDDMDREISTRMRSIERYMEPYHKPPP